MVVAECRFCATPSLAARPHLTSSPVQLRPQDKTRPIYQRLHRKNKADGVATLRAMLEVAIYCEPNIKILYTRYTPGDRDKIKILNKQYTG